MHAFGCLSDHNSRTSLRNCSLGGASQADTMTSSMETQQAIRRQALELQENIRELQKFAEQAKKKDAMLKAAAARRPKAPPAAAANGKVHHCHRHYKTTSANH